MNLNYNDYLNQVLGGWLGKCIGGTIGARFEGNKNWLEIPADQLFPDEIPPNDDLDLQVLWLHVLEQKGASFTSDDLARAWLDGCWYPFNEYGIFRRNWKLGIAPPYSGSFSNPFWGTGMGCPIRSEIWGFVCPGNPDLAADFAYRDGCLDHTKQSIAAEQMWSAMAAMAFEDHDVYSLIGRCIHYLPEGTPIAQLSQMAMDAHQQGLTLREARHRILANSPCAEACDAQINVPFTLLGLLYGEGDLLQSLICALSCGYDTDCTLATVGALLGQIIGGQALPADFIAPIGDDLVMGIQYRRDEMTISALARDTVRIGVLFGQSISGNATISGAPALVPLPAVVAPDWHLETIYEGLPSAAPGDTVEVTIKAVGLLPETLPVTISGPEGWTMTPSRFALSPLQREQIVQLHLSHAIAEYSSQNLFTVEAADQTACFGIKGAECWRLLGVFFDTVPDQPLEVAQRRRRMTNNFIYPGKEYLPLEADGVQAFQQWSRTSGRPAIIPVRELLVPLVDMIPLKTAWAAYLEREFILPEGRPLVLKFGHNAPLTVWLNGERLLEDAGETQWMSETTYVEAQGRKGTNTLRVRLDRTGADIDFSCLLADNIPLYPDKTWIHCLDYTIDHREINPFNQL